MMVAIVVLAGGCMVVVVREIVLLKARVACLERHLSDRSLVEEFDHV